MRPNQPNGVRRNSRATRVGLHAVRLAIVDVLKQLKGEVAEERLIDLSLQADRQIATRMATAGVRFTLAKKDED